MTRGRIDKRAAILEAAFTVFARQGYDQACVKEIAHEAGVAKPTVYNHLNDKETLFLQAMSVAAEQVSAANVAVLDRLRAAADLQDVAYRLVQVCCDERAMALRILTYAQLSRFPELWDTVTSRTSGRLRDALADRFARLSLAGELERCDPDVAAEQFLALLTGPMDTRSRLGTKKVTAVEARKVAEAAVCTFLSAYAGGTSSK